MPLRDSHLARVPEAGRALWTGVASALASEELKDRIFSVFAPDLCRRFRTDAPGLSRIPAYPRPTLIRDLSGYWIAPHPDSQAKIVTVQFYLARDLTQRALGNHVVSATVAQSADLDLAVEPVRTGPAVGVPAQHRLPLPGGIALMARPRRGARGIGRTQFDPAGVLPRCLARVVGRQPFGERGADSRPRSAAQPLRRRSRQPARRRSPRGGERRPAPPCGPPGDNAIPGRFHEPAVNRMRVDDRHGAEPDGIEHRQAETL